MRTAQELMSCFYHTRQALALLAVAAEASTTLHTEHSADIGVTIELAHGMIDTQAGEMERIANMIEALESVWEQPLELFYEALKNHDAEVFRDCMKRCLEGATQEVAA